MSTGDNVYAGVTAGIMTQANVTLKGLRETLESLRALPDEIGKQIERRVVKQAAEVIARAAEPKAPNTSGTTRRAVGYVVRHYGRANLTLGIVGIRRGFKTQVVWPGKKKARGHDPAWIAHLIEEGWRVARGGTLMREGEHKTAKSLRSGLRGTGVAVGRVPGRYMMRDALRETDAQVRSLITSETRRLLAEAAKTVAKVA